jgi:predicted MFS family arabinose efflux permease
MGVCGALLLVASEALLSDRHGEWSAVALSESNVAASACAISAPLLVGAFAASGLGWRPALVAPVAALALLAALSFSRSPGPPERDVAGEGGAPPGPRALPPRYWAFWALVTLGVGSEWCVGYWGADFLAGDAGFTRPGAATALTLFFVAMLAGRLLGQPPRARPPPTTLLAATLCVRLAGFPLFWLSGGTAPTLAGLFVTGFGIGSVYPLAVSAPWPRPPATPTPPRPGSRSAGAARSS